MTITVPAALTLRGSMLARLDLVDVLKVYDAIIPQDNQPVVIDDVGTISPYCVLYSGGGQAWSDRACQTPNMLTWAPQITVVGSSAASCLDAVDRIRAELTGTRLTIGDGVTGILREPDGDRPLIVDERADPPRFSYPLLYEIRASK